ncbi:MAG: hypothetical protein ACQKBU_08900, partial [Verrucomicrobiales bacterium]
MPRFRVGILSALQVIFVIILFFAVNFISSQHHRPFDLSDDAGFTLSSSTQSYLESDTIRNRENPIKMIVAFRADSPFYERIRPIAEEYARISGGKIKLTLLDPIRANDRAELIAAEYQMILNQDMVIIDARSAEEQTGDQTKQGRNHIHIARLQDMVVHETDANGQRRVRGFLGEDALRTGLVNAVEGRPRRMLVFEDKSDLGFEGGNEVWPVFSANMMSQNILPERVSLAGLESIPDDVEAVAIIGARYDLTPEELKVLEAYWARPKASILITTGDSDIPKRLRIFLRTNGVTPRNDRVLTHQSGQIRTSVIAKFTSGMELTQDLWEKTTMFEGTTR